MNIDEIRNIASIAGDRFSLWSQVLKATDTRVMAEIGVWKGDFAKQILEDCGEIEQYYMIDPWASLPDWNKPYNVANEVFDDIYSEAMEKTKFAANKLKVLRGRTKDVIKDIPDGSLDYVYIDGDHTLRGITIDLIQIFPKIKEGGIIAGDDFSSDPWQHGPKYEPTLVCPFSIYFAEAINQPIIVLPFKQFYIQKSVDAEFSFTDLTGEYSDISLTKLPKMRQKVKSALSAVIGR